MPILLLKQKSSIPKMPEEETDVAKTGDGSKEESKTLFGLKRKVRYKIYAWLAIAIVLVGLIWSIVYLLPWRWYKYTDKIAVEKVARDVDLGYVVWENSEAISEGLQEENYIDQTEISSDGTRMIYATGGTEGNSNLFLRRWDGNNWGDPRPMRALNSNFNETSPSLSGNGDLLLFASDRPGGQGGNDIWISKWDGAEYAWPLPLTSRVNTPFDETDPSITPDGLTVFFTSNRPHQAADISEKEAAKAAEAEQLSNVTDIKVDYDLYSADVAGDALPDLIIERQLSMLYSLREGALADIEVMKKLGGSEASEVAIDKALEYLVANQEEDGRWDISKGGGKKGHDVAATAFSLLAFYGRGERHDQQCKYQDNVRRGLDWLKAQEVGIGDMRGKGNMYDHGIAALALVEAYGVTKDPDLRPTAQAVIDFIVDSQHEEGGWRYKPGDRGDLSVSGWMVMALASAEMSGLPIPGKTKAGVKNFLQIVSGGKDGGSYGYTDSPGAGKGNNAMNAVGFFCAQLNGASANAARAFESSLILDAAGFQLNDIYYAYYGTLAAYQHQGPVWKKWTKKMHGEFLKAQAEDGSWQFGGAHAGAMGKFIGTALVSLCLEAHYRYTPLYGLGFEPDLSTEPNPDIIEGDALPRTPIFRHAKHLALISSPADDSAPVVTDHGDFLYFASSRKEGRGGSDIYRARLDNNEPMEAENLGEEINTKFNETHPSIRMAGFHLLFNSDREGNPFGLYNSKSKRVVRRYNYSKLPSSSWLGSNAVWLISLIVSAGLLVYFAIRLFKKPPRIQEAPDTITQPPVS
ncbi:MAG: hypothetical protein HOK49_12990 [Opitutae bacterium]|nr:hypothetical protein [Opitutae bacterium]